MKRFWTVVFSLTVILSMMTVPGVTVQAHALPTWKQVNAAPNEPMAENITALAEFKGRIYAGTSVSYPYLDSDIQSAVYRSRDGKKWDRVSIFGFGDTFNNKHIWAMTVFRNQLYVGTGAFYETTPEGDINHVSQIWRSTDGDTWEAVNTNGFGDPENLWVNKLYVYNGMVYSIITGKVLGLQIFRSPNGNPGTWVKTTTQFDDPTALYLADGLATFKGMLYISSEGFFSRTQVWRSRDGLAWSAANAENFGLADPNLGGGGLGIFKNQLYVGVGLEAGGQIWRTQDGKNWNRVMEGGFGDVHNWNVESFIHFKGDLYAVTANEVTGAEVWRTHNGADWEQVNQDGFNGICKADGTYCNYGGYYGGANLIFKDSLYIGTTNPNGGEIWRLN